MECGEESLIKLTSFVIFQVLQAAAFGLVDVHIGISMATTRKQLERALANSAVLSKRASVKIRVEKFVAHAKKVMMTSFIYCGLVGTFMLVLGVCQPCWRAIWLCVPVFFVISTSYLTRSMTVSISSSWKHRKNIPQSPIMEQALSSAEINLPHSPMQSLAVRKKQAEHASIGISSATLSNDSEKARSSRPKNGKGKRAKKLKKMTVVQEADYEGTVVVTQIESGIGDTETNNTATSNELSADNPRHVRFAQDDIVEEEGEGNSESKGEQGSNSAQAHTDGHST
jgi:hypothetical protein